MAFRLAAKLPDYRKLLIHQLEQVDNGLEEMNDDALFGTYTDPHIRVEYSDGEVRQEFTIVYYGEACGFNVELDEESSSFVWVSLNRVMELPLADSQKRRIKDVIEYLETGKKSFE